MPSDIYVHVWSEKNDGLFVCLSFSLCLCVCVWDMSVVVWMMMAKHVGNAKNKRFIGQVSRRASNYIFFSPLLLGWKIAKTGHGINVNVFIFSIKKKKERRCAKMLGKKEEKLLFCRARALLFLRNQVRAQNRKVCHVPGPLPSFCPPPKKKKK